MNFFDAFPIQDILDSIGAIYAGLRDKGSTTRADNWKSGITRILSEEVMGYRLDAMCAVRRLIDGEFQRNRFATIVGLGAPKYKAALTHYELACAALEASPMDTRAMVRGVFEAVEEVFKLRYQVARLTASTAGEFQPQSAEALQPGQTASKEMASSFVKWVVAAQQYRHAAGIEHEGHENPGTPSQDLAITMFGTGSAFLRWLIASGSP
jgi:hypothetical protein